MSVHRRAPRRDQNEAAIIAALRATGATVVQISAAGVPDLLVGYQGQNYLIECKLGRNGLTPAQKEWHQSWEGNRIYVARTEEDALRAIGAIP